MNIQKKIRKILQLLNKAYGRPKALRMSDPVDELIRTVLSQNTTDKNSHKAFAILKREFKSWDGILKVDARRIARLIRHAGLANIKAKRIKDILREIKAREGRLNLLSLNNLSVEDSLRYLKSLKGVGPKTAACVLLFSFKKPIMPVDTHIFRVTKRLGLIKKSLNIEEAHSVLSTIVPRGLTLRRGRLRRPCSGSRATLLSKALIYEFHLGIIEHGRRTCRAHNPKCGICILYDICAFKDKAKFKKRGLN